MGVSHLADGIFTINTPQFSLVPALLTITGALPVAAIDGLPAAPQPTTAWTAATSHSKPGHPINGLV
jgi:hypothetical protein